MNRLSVPSPKKPDCSFKSWSDWNLLITVYGGSVEVHLFPSLSLASSSLPLQVWRLSISVYLVWGQRANIDRVDLNERRSISAAVRLRWVFLTGWRRLCIAAGLGGGWRIFGQQHEAAGASHQHEPFSFIYFPSLHPSHWLLPPSTQLVLNHQFFHCKLLQSLSFHSSASAASGLWQNREIQACFSNSEHTQWPWLLTQLVPSLTQWFTPSWQLP